MELIRIVPKSWLVSSNQLKLGDGVNKKKTCSEKQPTTMEKSVA